LAVAVVLDARRAKGDGRVLLDVEKVGGAEVFVTLRVAALDGRDVDRGFDRRLGRVLADHEMTGGHGGAAAYLRHPQVAGGERHVGMGLVECVRSRGRDVTDGLRRRGGHDFSSGWFVGTGTKW